MRQRLRMAELNRAASTTPPMLSRRTIMHSNQPLWVEVLRGSTSLRRAALTLLLKRPLKDGSVSRRVSGVEVFVAFFGAWWHIRRNGKVINEGRGLFRLAQALYGDSIGAAAALFLEGVGFENFDDQCKGEIAAAVDSWAARKKADEVSE